MTCGVMLIVSTDKWVAIAAWSMPTSTRVMVVEIDQVIGSKWNDFISNIRHCQVIWQPQPKLLQQLQLGTSTMAVVPDSACCMLDLRQRNTVLAVSLAALANTTDLHAPYRG